jgi:hypothetical protein
MPDAKIGEFLIRLSEDPDLLREFYEDPKRVIEESELSEEKREILLSEDALRIQDEVRAEYPARDIFFLFFRPVFLRP